MEVKQYWVLPRKKYAMSAAYDSEAEAKESSFYEGEIVHAIDSEVVIALIDRLKRDITFIYADTGSMVIGAAMEAIDKFRQELKREPK